MSRHEITPIPALLERPWKFLVSLTSNSSVSETNESLKPVVESLFLTVECTAHDKSRLSPTDTFCSAFCLVANGGTCVWRIFFYRGLSICLSYFVILTFIKWQREHCSTKIIFGHQYCTFHVSPYWDHETSCAGSLGMPSSGFFPSVGACTLDYVAANGAGSRRHHGAYQCWSDSLPKPWEPGGCLGGAPNTWMDPGMREKRWCKVWTSKGNLVLTGINWDRPE